MRPLHAILPVALLAVASCGTGNVEARPEAPATPPNSASPSTSKPAGPGIGILPAAPDGTDLDACADGTCEVQVKPGDKITFKEDSLGVDVLKVKSVGANKVSVQGTAPGISLSVGGTPSAKPLKMNDLKVTIVVVREKKAILRLSH